MSTAPVENIKILEVGYEETAPKCSLEKKYYFPYLLPILLTRTNIVLTMIVSMPLSLKKENRQEIGVSIILNCKYDVLTHT